jgi:hypothetical protein
MDSEWIWPWILTAKSAGATAMHLPRSQAKTARKEQGEML